MSWPLISVSGDPRERGRAYGKQARDRVHASISLYESLIGHHTGLTWARVRDLAGPFVGPLDAYDPRLLPEIEGIAEGAGVDAEDVLAINLRTELLSVQRLPGVEMIAECTAISVVAEGGSAAHVCIGQNWDWTPRAAETCVVLASAPRDGPRSVTVVEAGLLAKCGANAAGIGVAANALSSSVDAGQIGVPFHAILRRILSSESLEEAEDAVMSPSRSSSGNYLIASSEGRSVDLEAAPGGPDMVARFAGPRLVHTNHFLRSAAPFADTAVAEPGSTSRHRYAAASRSLEGSSRGDVEGILTVLRDHDGRPGSVCKHRSPSLDVWDDSITLAAMAADLTEGTVWISQGPPCEAPLDVYSLR